MHTSHRITNNNNNNQMVRLPTLSNKVVQTPLQDRSEVHVRSDSAVEDVEIVAPTSPLVCVSYSLLCMQRWCMWLAECVLETTVLSQQLL
jgi:hypothetical protein